MTEDKKVPALVQHLLSLAEDRAALARLRRGLGKPPGADVASYPDVVPFIPDRDLAPQRSWPYFVVAALFAAHPRHHADAGNFGASVRRLPASPTRDGRFKALLNAHEDELGAHLRQLVRQLESQGIAIDWVSLLGDLRWWSHGEQRVQQRWARAFWGSADEDDEQTLQA